MIVVSFCERRVFRTRHDTSGSWFGGRFFPKFAERGDVQIVIGCAGVR
ncbi:hypothetical protein JQ557_08150 [Bradyrhizobium sp. U87765 SZCCT0131]|nr:MULTISPECIES: hypothetical protein [unclassified Bradyrhizobium]MBR1217956.1 hypothetical protein [Bradyrhizobium sp. U87765 SZCCT0131]MBR1261098.1 hypothetical protein [Bradyrhizobium sp. U87765 SZCCT0134]MBR1303454.1 hypothetical protein [Bradyrhizobium sp. U87765 SZCCT0110]MBR1319060.1 hypothetical protein [Bradyrhizobium sp. U87765 SZCCT0109]MBR1347385.1 hypothetical protein [Bradyrhizobium sp. U87765 SZCCT0048]